MARERKKSGGGEGGAPAWMCTYADLMSLLLCFFILLLSFSSINESEFKEAMTALQGSLGVMPQNTHMVMPYMASKQAASKTHTSRENARRMARELKQRLQVRGLDREVRVEPEDERGGLKIEFPGNLLFEQASARVRAEAYPILGVVANVLRDLPGAAIEIRGHTDSLPLTSTTTLGDNWDLSYFRAKAIKDILARAPGMQTRLFEPIACGPSQPKESNDTESGREANRRVELFVRGDFADPELEALYDRVQGLVQEDTDPFAGMVFPSE